MVKKMNTIAGMITMVKKKKEKKKISLTPMKKQKLKQKSRQKELRPKRKRRRNIGLRSILDGNGTQTNMSGLRLRRKRGELYWT